MAKVRHGELAPSASSGIHVIQNWEVASATALAALVPASDDVGKVALLLDTKRFYILRDATGPVWDPLALARLEYVAVSESRQLLSTDIDKCLRCGSADSIVITFPKDDTLNIPIGMSGLIRWSSGVGQVSVAAEDGDVTMNSSGGELLLPRVQAQVYWEKEAANTYFFSGEKSA